MADYLRPSGLYRTQIEVSKSKFIATAYVVDTVLTVKQRLAEVQKEMMTANHHVYAFIVGHGASVIEGLSDAGEPGGTAGQPVMAVLRGSGLGDTLIVVSRYFGGTLLGTGGLVRAYTDAAKAVLAGVVVERKIDRTQVLIIVPYSAYERSIRLIKEYDTVILDEEFGGEVTLLIEVPEGERYALEGRINDLCAGKATFADL